jgi:primosomal protein N' (replication factor Y)
MSIVRVAVLAPIDHPLSYRASANLEPGTRVVCPLGSRRVMGVVLGPDDAPPEGNLKSIVSVLDEVPALDGELLGFIEQLATYYFAPIGEAVKLALPPVEREAAMAIARPTLLAKKGGVARLTERWVVPLVCESGARPPRGQAQLLLSHLRAVGEAPVRVLEGKWPSARSLCKRLDDLGLLRVEERDVAVKPNHGAAVEADTPPELTRAQGSACERLAAAIGGGGHTFLLHGVTGSGKTEVYLQAIAAAKAQGLGSIVLVPEIALTPQLVSRFRARFGDELAVVHSMLPVRERLHMWNALRSGKVNVVIGARSALFAPVARLGLIVVDEEHDSSFKQEDGVRYNGRDMAILRAHRAHGVCVLGSATPSLESEFMVTSGKAERLVLPSRAREQTLPKVQLVDLRRMGAGPTGDRRLSIPLHRAIERTLAAGEQTILFLNRRGFAPTVLCETCGKTLECPSCSVALTFHKRGKLVCHYCEYESLMPKACPKCSAPSLMLDGLGTEKLEETLRGAFPAARIGRLDRDVGAGKKGEAIIEKVRSGELDILVGTQMVTKGHDLPNVTLVGVINADAALSIPDFRATERGFQLMVQVAGRAGRGDLPGQVLVQTYNPAHPALTFMQSHDVTGFIARELADRRELGYPPFSRLVLLRVDAVDESIAREACARVAEIARRAGEQATALQVIGPAPAPLERLRGRYRFRVLLRSTERRALRYAVGCVQANRAHLPRAARLSIDVDPVQLL